MSRLRDGVWRSNSLSADFVLIYAHPHAKDVYRVRTAAGDHYAFGRELTWDIHNYENKTES